MKVGLVDGDKLGNEEGLVEGKAAGCDDGLVVGRDDVGGMVG